MEIGGAALDVHDNEQEVSGQEERLHEEGVPVHALLEDIVPEGAVDEPIHPDQYDSTSSDSNASGLVSAPKRRLTTPLTSVGAVKVKKARPTPPSAAIVKSGNLKELPEAFLSPDKGAGRMPQKPAAAKPFSSAYLEVQTAKLSHAQESAEKDRQLQAQQLDMERSKIDAELRLGTQQAKAKMYTDLLVAGLPLAQVEAAVLSAFPK
jgi:hypothetical protein